MHDIDANNLMKIYDTVPRNDEMFALQRSQIKLDQENLGLWPCTKSVDFKFKVLNFSVQYKTSIFVWYQDKCMHVHCFLFSLLPNVLDYILGGFHREQ